MPVDPRGRAACGRDPDRGLQDEQRFPFATIVTKDYGDFDNASSLNREGVFRLNLGLSRERYQIDDLVEAPWAPCRVCGSTSRAVAT